MTKVYLLSAFSAFEMKAAGEKTGSIDITVIQRGALKLIFFRAPAKLNWGQHKKQEDYKFYSFMPLKVTRNSFPVHFCTPINHISLT